MRETHTSTQRKLDMFDSFIALLREGCRLQDKHVLFYYNQLR